MASKPSYGPGDPTRRLGIERGDAYGAVGRVSIERLSGLSNWPHGSHCFLSDSAYDGRIDEILRPGDALRVQRRQAGRRANDGPAVLRLSGFLANRQTENHGSVLLQVVARRVGQPYARCTLSLGQRVFKFR